MVKEVADVKIGERILMWGRYPTVTAKFTDGTGNNGRPYRVCLMFREPTGYANFNSNDRILVWDAEIYESWTQNV